MRALYSDVCIGMTMLLAVSVFQMTINDILPVTSDTVPLIGMSHLQITLQKLYYDETA